MSEVARIILGLQSMGWNSEKILNLLLWIGTGDEKYRHNIRNDEDAR